MSGLVFGGGGDTSIGTLLETAEMGFAVLPVDDSGWAAYAAITPRPTPSTPQSSATNSPRLLMRRNLPGRAVESEVRGLDVGADRSPFETPRPSAPQEPRRTTELARS